MDRHFPILSDGDLNVYCPFQRHKRCWRVFSCAKCELANGKNRIFRVFAIAIIVLTMIWLKRNFWNVPDQLWSRSNRKAYNRKCCRWRIFYVVGHICSESGSSTALRVPSVRQSHPQVIIFLKLYFFMMMNNVFHKNWLQCTGYRICFYCGLVHFQLLRWIGHLCVLSKLRSLHFWSK